MENSSSFFWDIYSKLYDTLNLLKPYRDLHEQVLTALNLQKNETILDAGCGTGIFEKLMIEKGIDSVRVEALDFSSAMLKRAKQKSNNHSFNFQQFDLNNKLPFPDNYFDKIISINAIYALKDPKFAIKEFYRVLKPQGMIVITTPKYGAKILPIFFKHLCKAKISRTLLALPALILVGIFNVFIRERGAKKIYHFLDQQKLLNIFNEVEYLNISTSSVYADQTWLVIGRK